MEVVECMQVRKVINRPEIGGDVGGQEFLDYKK